MLVKAIKYLYLTLFFFSSSEKTFDSTTCRIYFVVLAVADLKLSKIALIPFVERVVTEKSTSPSLSSLVLLILASGLF
jgi:uncharacterized membrane protein YccF (DUF307 family)